MTHEPEIAACAERVVTIRDGRVVADERPAQDPATIEAPRIGDGLAGRHPPVDRRAGDHSARDQIRDLRQNMLLSNVRTALRVLRTHRLRSALTMLGIVIGVAAV